MVPAPSDTSVMIRRATLRDAEAILACLRLAFAPYQNLYTPAAFDDTVLTHELLHERLKNMTVLVAENRSKQIVGTIAGGMIGDAEVHLRGMIVLPERQGHGVAQALLERAETELKQRACKRITLDTTEHLIPAMRFYERNGFRRTGRISDFFGMPLIEYAKEISWLR